MEKKYNNLTLFKNQKAGKPMYKDGVPITNNKGEYVLIPEFNGVLKIEQPLPVGEYEIKLREKVARSGATYYWGGIRKKEDDKFNQNNYYEKKANGYQRESTLGLVRQPAKKIEVEDDEIPF